MNPHQQHDSGEWADLVQDWGSGHMEATESPLQNLTADGAMLSELLHTLGAPEENGFGLEPLKNGSQALQPGAPMAADTAAGIMQHALSRPASQQAVQQQQQIQSMQLQQQQPLAPQLLPLQSVMHTSAPQQHQARVQQQQQQHQARMQQQQQQQARMQQQHQQQHQQARVQQHQQQQQQARVQQQQALVQQQQQQQQHTAALVHHQQTVAVAAEAQRSLQAQAPLVAPLPVLNPVQQPGVAAMAAAPGMPQQHQQEVQQLQSLQQLQQHFQQQQQHQQQQSLQQHQQAAMQRLLHQQQQQMQAPAAPPQVVQLQPPPQSVVLVSGSNCLSPPLPPIHAHTPPTSSSPAATAAAAALVAAQQLSGHGQMQAPAVVAQAPAHAILQQHQQAQQHQAAQQLFGSPPSQHVLDGAGQQSVRLLTDIATTQQLVAVAAEQQRSLLAAAAQGSGSLGSDAAAAAVASLPVQSTAAQPILAPIAGVLHVPQTAASAASSMHPTRPAQQRLSVLVAAQPNHAQPTASAPAVHFHVAASPPDGGLPQRPSHKRERSYRSANPAMADPSTAPTDKQAREQAAAEEDQALLHMLEEPTHLAPHGGCLSFLELLQGSDSQAGAGQTGHPAAPAATAESSSPM